MLPDWYGKRYPSEMDLTLCAESHGARVVLGRLPIAAYAPAQDGVPPMLLIPNQHGPLETMWLLAHELAHLVLHYGPAAPLWSKDESQANRWAACALIPLERIRHYMNASPDAFIAALSANYEPLPPENCRQRELANRIATIRLEVMKAKGELAEAYAERPRWADAPE
jgi:hypothetical protein